jgi:hypothetical protein
LPIGNTFALLRIQANAPVAVAFNGGTFAVDIGANGASDQLIVTGGAIDLTGTDTLIVSQQQFGAFDGYDYNLATFPENLNGGTFNSVQGLANGYSVQYSATNIKLVAPQLPFALTAAVSRKSHVPFASVFDVNLAAPEPVECRSSNGLHTLVFTFNNVLASGGISITAGAGQVQGAPTFSGKTMTANLVGVADVQKLGVTLQKVTDRFGQVLPATTFTINMLTGDVNGDRVVNAGDALLTRNRAGSTASATTFRSDVNLDGVVNGGDTILIRSRAGGGLP